MEHRERADTSREQLLAELSTHFLQIESDDLDAAIQAWLGRLGRRLRADRCHVFLLSSDQQFLTNTHEWSADGVAPQKDQLQRVPRSAMPWLSDRILSNRTVALSTIDDLPPAAGADRGALQQQGIRSLLLVPLAHRGTVIGTIGLDAVGHERTFSSDDSMLLRLAGEVFANAVVRRRAEERLREKEAQLHQAQKLEAIGRLAGGVAHDINNLLQAVLATAEQLDRGGPEVDAAAAAREIGELVGQGSRLTRQLLLLARKEITAPEILDVNHVLEESWRLLRRLVRENIAFETDPWAQPLWISADRGQLEQVLMNLVVNATEAMPQGGRLTLGCRPDGERVRIEISDTGVGIPEEARQRVFEPFFSTKGAGDHSGLGLAVVQSILADHGGSVELESGTGAGTTFSLLLPLHTPPAAPVQSATPSSRPAARALRVLLVEDNPAARDGLEQMLRLLGHGVVAVGSAEEALGLGEHEPFEVLLTDVMLPGMHGLELARHLRRRWPRLEVVAMSGYAEDEGARRALEDVQFLQKPFGMRRLAEALDRPDDP